MKKMVMIIGMLGVVVAGVWAGGNGESSADDRTVTLTIAGRDGSFGEAMELATALYREENPNVEFEILKLSGSALFEQTVVDMRSGEGSYDVVLIDDPNAPQYMAAGWLADLGAMYAERGIAIDEDFIDPAVGVARYPAGDGTLYALPHVGNVALFAYRTDLFARYDLAAPDRWDEVITAAGVLAENEPEVIPVLFRGSRGNPIVTGFLPVLWAFGGDILDDAGEVVLDSPESLDALEFFLRLSEYAPEGVANYQSAQVRDALYNGSGAIAIEVWPGWIAAINDPSESAVVDRMQIRAHPAQVRGSSPMIGIWLAAIPESSANKDAAFDFLTFLTSAETQRRIALEAGVPPTRVSVHQDPELQERYFWYAAQLEGLQAGVARPRTNHWSEIESTFGEYLQRALIGELTPEETLAQADARLREIVE
ncbi:MAG: ABC transporter substrate-binding protein [Spirochaetales bacterium]|nr:ABC transporter substrate-binding protein [Spirochaetales bacterium]